MPKSPLSFLQPPPNVQFDYNQEPVQIRPDWEKVNQMARDVGVAVNTFVQCLDNDPPVDKEKLAEIFLDHLLRAHATPMVFMRPVDKDA